MRYSLLPSRLVVVVPLNVAIISRCVLEAKMRRNGRQDASPNGKEGPNSNSRVNREATGKVVGSSVLIALLIGSTED